MLMETELFMKEDSTNIVDALVEKDQEWTQMEVYFSAAGYL